MIVITTDCLAHSSRAIPVLISKAWAVSLAGIILHIYVPSNIYERMDKPMMTLLLGADHDNAHFMMWPITICSKQILLNSVKLRVRATPLNNEIVIKHSKKCMTGLA